MAKWISMTLSITTFSRMTLGKTGFNETLSIFHSTEWHSVYRHSAECHSVYRHSAEWHSDNDIQQNDTQITTFSRTTLGKIDINVTLRIMLC